MKIAKSSFKLAVLVFLNLGFSIISIASSTSPTAAVECGTGDSSKACIAAPAGIIAGSKKAGDLVTTFNWLLMAGSIVSCVIFLLKCSSRMSDEQYKEAIGPGLGAGLAGLTLYIAYQLVKS